MARSMRKNVILTLSSGRLDRDALLATGFESDDEVPTHDQGSDRWTWTGSIPSDAEERVRNVAGVLAVHPNSDLELLEQQ